MSSSITRRRTALAAGLLVLALTTSAFTSEASAMSPQQTTVSGVVNVVRPRINSFWAARFSQAGRSYSAPAAIRFYNPGNVSSQCGSTIFVDYSFYCASDRTITMNLIVNQGRINRGGDYAAGVIVAHEWGHHIQTIRGMVRSRYRPKQWELHADCMAGMATRNGVNGGWLDRTDYFEGRNQLFAIGDNLADSNPQHHGTPQERRMWFDYGYNHNSSVTSCDPALGAF